MHVEEAADLCSTGEQKALLIAIVLAMRGCARRNAVQRHCFCWTKWQHISIRTTDTLFHAIRDLGAQVWLLERTR